MFIYGSKLLTMVVGIISLPCLNYWQEWGGADVLVIFGRPKIEIEKNEENLPPSQ